MFFFAGIVDIDPQFIEQLFPDFRVAGHMHKINEISHSFSPE